MNVEFGLKDGRRLAGLILAVGSLVFGACASPATTPASTSGAVLSPGASTPGQQTSAPVSAATSPAPQTSGGSPSTLNVTSAAHAAALVLASNPLFAQIVPPSLGSINHAATYSAYPARGGFSVSVVMGSGDCLSGCVNTHTWNYVVNTAGEVGLLNETGSPIEITPPTPSASTAQVTITLVASPTCPVQQNPPNPSCAPRPVAGAQVVVRDTSGAQVASATSDATGAAVIDLPSGAYYVEAGPASGLPSQPEAVAFSVVGGSTVGFFMAYDTGIR